MEMLLSILNALALFIGIPVLVRALLDIGGKLKSLEYIEADIRDSIRPDLKDVRERLFTLEGKTSQLFASASPVQLLPEGRRILSESGMEKFIEQHQEKLLNKCGASKLSNPYDVQKAVFALFDEYTFSTDMHEQFKQYAFDHGITMDIIRRIGAIHFRDICLQHIGMSRDEIDAHDPEVQSKKA